MTVCDSGNDIGYPLEYGCRCKGYYEGKHFQPDNEYAVEESEYYSDAYPHGDGRCRRYGELSDGKGGNDSDQRHHVSHG